MEKLKKISFKQKILAKYIIECRRGFSSKTIYYHGTTSKYLKSILSNGLIPDPKEGVWKAEEEEKNLGVHAPSKKSLFGSYWSQNTMTCVKYANDSVRHFGGNPLFIIAELQERSAFPDEDTFLSLINRGISGLLGPGYRTNDFYLLQIFAGIILKKDIGLDAIKHWNDIIFDYLEQNGVSPKIKTPKFLQLLEDLLFAEIKRRLSYHSDTGLFPYKSEIRKALDYLGYKLEYDDPIPPQFKKIPSKQAEQEYQKYLDEFTKLIKKLAVSKEDDSFSHTIRVPSTVGFKGANKIITIIEAIEEKDNDTTFYDFVLQYGTDIPDKFILGWKQSMGYKVNVKTKKGDILYTIEK